jgi:hypothetical protein
LPEQGRLSVEAYGVPSSFPFSAFPFLLKERCQRDELGTPEEVLGRQFRLHLQRGISQLATPHLIRSIADLVRLAGEDGEAV